MSAELSTKELLESANRTLAEKALQPVTQRTLAYWISTGLVQHPKRKGKAGRGLFPESAKLDVESIRELQERFNFSLADVRALVAEGSKLNDVLNLMIAVDRTYGHSLVPYARSQATSHYIGPQSDEKAAEIFIALRQAEGDEDLTADQVAALLGKDSHAVLALASSHELPCHGTLQPRFLRREVSDWQARNAPPVPGALTDLVTHLIDLNNELCGISSLDGTAEKSREWLTYWLDALDNEFWRLRRLSREAKMKEKILSPEPGIEAAQP